jgi:hypothetical protein
MTGPVGGCRAPANKEIGLLLFAIEAHASDLRTICRARISPDETLRPSDAAEPVISAPRSGTGLLEDAPNRHGSPLSPVRGGAITVSHRKAVAVTGAIALAAEVKDSVRIVKSELAKQGAGH